MESDPDGARLPEHRGDEVLQAIRLRQQAQLGAQPVFLHDDRREEGIEGSEFERPIEKVGQDLRRRVVDGRRDFVDFFPGLEGAGLAEEGPQDVGKARDLPASGAASDPLVGNLRELQEFLGQRGDDRGPGGGHQFLFRPGGVDGDSLEQLRDGGRRDGQGAVAGLDESASHVERRAIERADLQLLGQPTASQDVHQGVVGSGLVEVGPAQGTTVDAGFGLEQPSEDPPGPAANGLREGTSVDDLFDVGHIPGQGMLAFDPDIDLERPQVRPLRFPDVDPDREFEPSHPLSEALGIGAQVQERPEHHVSAQPRGGVQVHEFHAFVLTEALFESIGYPNPPGLSSRFLHSRFPAAAAGRESSEK